MLSVTGTAYIHSFTRLSIFSGHTPSMDRRIATTSHFHDFKTTLTSISLTECPPTSIRRGFCTIASLTSLLHITVGSTPSTILPLARNCARIAFRCTRTSWMCGYYDFPRDWVLWLVALKFIVIPYHLLTCHSFSACIYTISSSRWSRTSPLMKSTITTSASSPPSYTTHVLVLPSTSIIQCEVRLYRYTLYIFRDSRPCMLQADTH